MRTVLIVIGLLLLCQAHSLASESRVVYDLRRTKELKPRVRIIIRDRVGVKINGLGYDSG